MTPRISNSPYKRLTIPELSGGINLRDGISGINDNQLLDGLNVWYEDGWLRTRPGLNTNENTVCTLGDMTLGCDMVDVVSTEVWRVSNSGKHQKLYALRSGFLFEGNYKYISFVWVGEGGVERLQGEIYDNSRSCFVVQSDSGLYCFVSCYTDLSGNDKLHKIYKYNGQDSWLNVGEDELYLPTVLTNGIPGALSGGSYNEDYNLLCDRYKMLFSTAAEYEEKQADGAVVEDDMKYTLLQDTAPFLGDEVTAVITDLEGNKHTHRVTLMSADGWNTESSSQDGIIMQVRRNTVRFLDAETKTMKTVPRSEFAPNNLSVTAPCRAEPDKVFRMKKAIWFSGETAGLTGGSRLFLGGNTAKGNETLVVWSAADNPLYFPKSNSARVGNPSQSVTAFGKQNDKLIIFKEHEMFYTKQSNEGGNAKFPMVELNSAIGCDCPDTVQLCRNRLVFATSSGRVYTLVAQNQFSELNLHETSMLIGKRLSAEKELKTAFSCDYDGRYMLFVGQRVYVMDYNSYGYSAISSHTKTEDANKNIPWWYLELPYAAQGVHSDENTACLLRIAEIGERSGATGPAVCYGCVAGFFDKDRYDDVITVWSDIVLGSGAEDVPIGQDGIVREDIKSSLKTKLFALEKHGKSKNVPKIHLSLGTDCGQLSAEVITDRGSEEINIDPETCELRDDAPQYFKSALLRPEQRPCSFVGLRLTARGNLSLDSFSFEYK